ncbi:hypothetical protein OIV83_005998 [Microbotryomycetes sp. JL201]|nr:hypothetical protein OIV83_005998 [Microbotryomycetes sp. JL201]
MSLHRRLAEQAQPAQRAAGRDLIDLDAAPDDTAPPPPSYDTALRHSLTGPPSQSPRPVQQQQHAAQAAPASPSFAAPPPSSHASTTAPATAAVQRRTSVEDPLAPLGKYDIEIIVDDSPSMLEGTRWQDLRSALMGVAEQAVRFDKDGINMTFMNADHVRLRNVTDVSTVREAFDTVQPTGSTPLAMVLDEICREFVERVEDAKPLKQKVKPMIVVVATDGRADDSDGVKDCILEMASRLDEIRAPPFQLGIQFLQVGNDPEAAEFLQELDDDLKGSAGVRDLTLLGSVNKRLDATN